MLLFAGNSSISGNQVVCFGKLRMWAERGLIHIEDGSDNSYKAISVRSALLRMRGIQEMIKNSGQHTRQKHSFDQFDGSRIAEYQGMLDAMVEVVRRAKEQGMPSDASARRDLVRRRPKTVLVPGNQCAM